MTELAGNGNCKFLCLLKQATAYNLEKN